MIFFMLIPLNLFSQGGVTSYDDYNDSRLQDTYFNNEYQQISNEGYEYLLVTPLNAYLNPYNSLSEYNFSFVRYANRSYDFRHNKIMIDGIELSDIFSGNNLWNLAYAAENIRQGKTNIYGLNPSAENIGSIGSIRTYDITAHSLKREYRVGFMFTDRRFRQGIRFSAATGLTKSGWAFALSGTRRWGRDQHITGVYFDNWSLNASISKTFAKRHAVSLTYLRAPTEQGLKGAATKEAFELTSNNLYNPYWGYQNGKVRNSRVRQNTPSLLMTTWDFKISDKINLSTSGAYIKDQNAYSSIDWYDATNPMPDYYRYMPSFYTNPDIAEDVRNEWISGNSDVTQINWAELYYANSDKYGNPASYIVSSRITDITKLQAVSTVNYNISKSMSLEGGVRIKSDISRNYNRLDDLLGGMYILDIDQYMIDDEYYGDKLENNIDEKGKHILKGDKFGYYYDLHHKSAEGWAILNLGNTERIKNLNGYVGIDVGYATFCRNGHFEKELFAGNLSKGNSETIRFTPYTVKGGLTYNINPSHNIGLNMTYADITPTARNLFISPDYQNATIKNPRPINILGGELKYRYSNRFIDISLAAYATLTRGETEIYHFYDDISSLYSNMIMSDIDKLFLGAELGVDIPITSRLSIKMAGALTENRYANNPKITQIADKNNEIITDNEPAYIRAYKLGGTPQRTAAAEIKYSGRLWMASVSVNYAGDNYIDINPIRRMKRVCDYALSQETITELNYQEKFPEATTINIFISKTFRLGTHYLSLSGSINNLANRKDIIYSGYEQMRLRKQGTGLNQTITPLGSKYYYAYGRTYYLTLNFKF